MSLADVVNLINWDDFQEVAIYSQSKFNDEVIITNYGIYCVTQDIAEVLIRNHGDRKVQYLSVDNYGVRLELYIYPLLHDRKE